MILSDRDIRKLCIAPLFHNGFPMIEPFSEPVSGGGVISYGLSSAGYDLRLGPDVMIFKNSYGREIDPKKFGDEEYRSQLFDEIKGLPCGTPVPISAHSYVLVRSLEYLRIPRNLKGRCVGKSTMARCGVIVNTTPLEPMWEGHLTIEISNSSPCSVVLYVGEGIAQLEFEQLSCDPEVTYADKHAGQPGKYQAQIGVTPARVV